MATTSRDMLYMAPMLGITDSAFRSGFMECFGGFDCAITPFLKTLDGGRCKENKLVDVLPSRNRALKIVPQILSNSADDFIPVAKALFDLGYDKININFGCPVPMAAGRGRGAGLLPHPDFVDRLLDQIMARIPNQLSIKTRVGFDRPDQLLAMTDIFNRYPLFEIAIHPRTAKQGYGGSINHDAFAATVANLRAEIIYSGDITSLDDFLSLKARYPHIRKWMLGRGALANPLLPRQLRQFIDEGAKAKDAALLVWDEIGRFYRNLIYQMEERQVENNVILSRLKTLFFYQAEHLSCEKTFIRRVRKARTLDELLTAVEDRQKENLQSLVALYSPSASPPLGLA